MKPLSLCPRTAYDRVKYKEAEVPEKSVNKQKYDSKMVFLAHSHFKNKNRKKILKLLSV